MKKINRRKLILAGQNDHQRELNIDYVRVGMICYPAEPVPLTHRISFLYPRVNLAGSHSSVSTKNTRGELRQIDKDKDISRLRTDNTTDYFRNVEVPGN